MSERYLKLDADFVRNEISNLLAAYPDLAEDEQLRQDAIEGETDAYRIIERAVSARQEATTMSAALAQRLYNLRSRMERLDRKADAMKSLIRHIMKAANLDKLTLPEATLSITKPRQSIGIDNLDDLPQGYFKTARVADKDAIRKAFDMGESVPGAMMVLGSEGLTIRTK